MSRCCWGEGRLAPFLHQPLGGERGIAEAKPEKPPGAPRSGRAPRSAAGGASLIPQEMRPPPAQPARGPASLEVEPEAHATPALRGSSTEEGDGRLTRADTPRAAAECAAAEPATDAHLIEVRAGSPGRGALLTSCWPLGPHPAYCSFALLTSGGSRL